jgi:hypothetical protein
MPLRICRFSWQPEPVFSECSRYSQFFQKIDFYISPKGLESSVTLHHSREGATVPEPSLFPQGDHYRCGEGPDEGFVSVTIFQPEVQVDVVSGQGSLEHPDGVSFCEFGEQLPDFARILRATERLMPVRAGGAQHEMHRDPSGERATVRTTGAGVEELASVGEIIAGKKGFLSHGGSSVG